MKLRKKIVITIIILIVISLSGLISLQIYLLNRAIQLEKQSFQNNVNSALNSIVKKLETRETLTRIVKVHVNDSTPKRVERDYNIQVSDTSVKFDKSYIFGLHLTDPEIAIDSNRVQFTLEKPQHVKMVIIDSLGKVIAKPVDKPLSAGTHIIELDKVYNENYKLQFSFGADTASCVIRMIDFSTTLGSHSTKLFERRQLIERVLKDITTDKPTSILDRLKSTNLDSIVKITLAENGIILSYAYGIVMHPSDSVLVVKPANFIGDIRKSKFRTILFPLDVFVEENYLVLYFPTQQSYLIAQTSIIGLISFIFIIIIIFCFIYVIKTILRQKDFSVRLIDFINNMTHEFKTPISTILLASETLTNPAILNDKTKLIRYKNIIADESQRMRTQVEKILQMAALEGEELELKRIEVDVHELINQVSQNIQLQLASKNATIETQFLARIHTVNADVVHFTNIIYNLLDNALKYSNSSPQIYITTENENHYLKISIKDNGLGLSEQQQKLVFEKYYRVPTGNVHNVKGFGLGLSYVKLIVEAHNGSVEVDSKPGEGSTFTVLLPTNEDIR